MTSAVVVAFARFTASRRLSTPSLGSTISVVVETVNIVSAAVRPSALPVVMKCRVAASVSPPKAA